MPGAHRTLQFGPATYEVSAAVKGGQLVTVDGTTGKVKPTTGTSDKVLGVALSDAQASGTNPSDPLNVAWPQKLVAVGYGPGEYRLVAADAVSFGDFVVAAADGEVAKYDPSPDPGAAHTADMIVGKCTEPGNIAADGTGRIRLLV